MKVRVTGWKEPHITPPNHNEVLALKDRFTGRDVLVFTVPTPKSGILYAFVESTGVSYLQSEYFEEHVRTCFTYTHSCPISKMEVILHA